MYKLLIRGIATNGLVNWSYYKKFNQEFATQDVEKAIAQYRELLDYYGINNVNFVNVITPDIIVEYEEHICETQDDEENPEEPEEPITPEEPEGE